MNKLTFSNKKHIQIYEKYVEKVCKYEYKKKEERQELLKYIIEAYLKNKDNDIYFSVNFANFKYSIHLSSIWIGKINKYMNSGEKEKHKLKIMYEIENHIKNYFGIININNRIKIENKYRFNLKMISGSLSYFRYSKKKPKQIRALLLLDNKNKRIILIDYFFRTKYTYSREMLDSILSSNEEFSKLKPDFNIEVYLKYAHSDEKRINSEILKKNTIIPTVNKSLKKRINKIFEYINTDLNFDEKVINEYLNYIYRQKDSYGLINLLNEMIYKKSKRIYYSIFNVIIYNDNRFKVIKHLNKILDGKKLSLVPNFDKNLELIDNLFVHFQNDIYGVYDESNNSFVILCIKNEIILVEGIIKYTKNLNKFINLLNKCCLDLYPTLFVKNEYKIEIN